jgi:hypothetical protein
MLENNGREATESRKMMALTLALTNFLLLTVGGGAFWLAQMILNGNDRFGELTRGFNFH